MQELKLHCFRELYCYAVRFDLVKRAVDDAGQFHCVMGDWDGMNISFLNRKYVFHGMYINASSPNVMTIA